jgi:triacylglycerol lipase
MPVRSLLRLTTSLTAMGALTVAVAVGCGASATPEGTRDARAQDARVDASATDSAPDAEPSLEDVFFPPTDAATEAAVTDASDASARRGPPYPLILHHGFAGFRDIGPINYYFNVGRDLRARGERVYEAEVAPFDSPAARALQLSRYVDRVLAESNSQKVILVAHSQGGLDSRHMISSLAYGDRVAALVTISTPHRGTRVADTVLGFVPGATQGFINAIAMLFAWTYNEARERMDLSAALVGLSEREAMAFNRANPDDPRVRYWSYAGRSHLRTGVAVCGGARYENEPLRVDSTTLPLAPFAALLEGIDPLNNVNDGMVTVQSARWGEFQGCIPADHFDEVGQIARTGPIASGFDHIAFYRKIAADLRAAGL